MKGDALDPKALIREAYRIDGITIAQCRTIFLDWALSHPDGADPKEGVVQLLAQYADQPADHPMSVTLNEGLGSADAPRRRGGRAARMLD